MRTTDVLDLTLAGKPCVSRPSGFMGTLTTLWRLVRNRHSIGSLHDLDDHQLLDMGLRREDLREALTSSFFDDPARHLTQVARNRTNGFYRNLRRD